jgi:hypothetical protein
MNMNAGAKTVYLTMYYDYVEGHPAHFKEVKPVWFDVAQCGTSEVSGGSPNTKFDIRATTWTANFDGEILHAGGHLHDGGTVVDLLVDGKVVCKSEATYGTDGEALQRSEAAIRGEIMPLAATSSAPAPPAMEMAAPKAGGGHSHAGGRHIIAMNICTDNRAGLKGLPISKFEIKDLRKGQKWVLRATYDYNKNMGMKQGNTQRMSTVMGIAIMYVKTTTPRKAV